MLWLALTFPKLPLEAQSERAAARQTAAGAFVVEQGQVCVVDAAAEAAGVMPGMRFSTARSLLPEGRVLERDAAAIGREQSALDALACFAGSVTPAVCVDRPASLLLEIGGCLRLFGGIAPIVGHLRRGYAERGITVSAGIAPTPRGAAWLAQALDPAPGFAVAGAASAAGRPGDRGDRSDRSDRSDHGDHGDHGDRSDHGDVRLPASGGIGARACCLTREALPEMLAPLPVEVLAAGAAVRDRLHAFGVRRLGELMALPRGGLARRIGPEPVAQLMQALGELPDPRAPQVFPERFRQAVELPAPASDAAMLGFPARRLIADFCGWLAVRQSGATRCRLLLVPERRGLPTERLELRLAAASRDPARFERLLRERLERTPLAAPVGDLVLEAGAPGELVPLPGHSASLLDSRQPAAPLEVLLERLRARLGEEAVHGLCIHPDHRPECASRDCAVGFADGAAGAARRPLSLLEPPEALGEVDGRPARRGEPLELLSGPERIESGWWDEGEVRADGPPGRGVEAADQDGGWAGGEIPGPFGGEELGDVAGDVAAEGGGQALGPALSRPGRSPGRPAPGDVRRDYFLARSRQGECWWIFRDAAGWWAQGLGFFN